MITVGIAEDQALVRESLAIVLGLQDGIHVVWTTDSGSEAVALCGDTPVDIVLMDLRLPGMDGAVATRHVKKLHPASHVLILTTFHQDEWLLDALHAGATACFLKEIPPQLLIGAIVDIHNGTWSPDKLPPDWRRYAPDIQFRAKASPSQGMAETLAPRDVELLRYICAGYTNSEISEKLYLSEGTVKNYVSALYAKLGVRHRSQAVQKAHEIGVRV